MKQYTTRFLKTVAAFFMVFPMSYIVVAGMLFDIPLNACGKILLSPFYYLITVCGVVAGYGLWEMRRWSWYLFLVAQLLLVYGDAVLVLNYAESYHKVFAFFVSLLVQLVLIYRVSREVRVPYLFPKIRWWESNPRYRLAIATQGLRKNGVGFTGEVLDLSMAGCFIKIQDDVLLDEKVAVQFKVYGYEIQCQGRVVWMTQSSVTHPKGIGVKFDSITKQQKRIFRSIGRRLRKIADHYRRSRYLMSAEDFQKQFELIESAERPLIKKASKKTHIA